MINAVLHAFTNLGDSAITATFVLGLAAYLLVFGQKRPAVALLASYALTAFCIILGKVIIYSRCASSEILFGLHSPSGHSALSLVAFGMFSAFVSSSLTGWRRYIPFAVTLPVVGLISFSRVFFGFHTVSDVCLGLFIGTAAGVGAWLLFMRGKAVRCRWWPFTIIALTFLAILHGQQLRAEDLIERLSDTIRSHIPPC